MTKDTWSVCLLPHVYRRDLEVLSFFESSALATLQAQDVASFDAMIDGISLATLRQRGPSAAQFATSACDSGFAIACPPVASATSDHLLVIEPHMDDGVLSTAGAMLLRRDTRRITLLSVVGWSESTKMSLCGHAPLDRAGVSRLRRAESLLAGRFVGFHHEMMDELDFPIRLRASQPAERPWPNFALLDAAKRFAPSADEVASLSARLFARVRALAPDEVWMPLGVGENPDHVLTSMACIHMLNTEHAYFAGKRLSLYEDMAPFPRFAGHFERVVAVHDRTGSLRVVDEDVTEVFEDKLRAVSLYTSQIDMVLTARPISNVGALLTSSSTSVVAPPRKLETHYEVARVPKLAPFGELAFRPLDLSAAKLALAPFIRHRLIAKRVVLFNTTSFGRWKLGFDVLRHVFPNAKLEIFAADDHAWEVSNEAALSVRQLPTSELAAALDQLPADGALTLAIGDAKVFAGSRNVACIRIPTFGDAIMALQELVSG